MNQKRNEAISKQDNYVVSKRSLLIRKPELSLFYEYEPAVVVDIILNEDHPQFKGRKLDPNDYPANADGSSPVKDDPDFGWIGRAKVRMLYSQKGTHKEFLGWAYPLENTGVVEYPLVNELVAVVKYLDRYYYTRKINTESVINSSADIRFERIYGLLDSNREDNSDEPYKGPISELLANKVDGINTGALGRYFKFNHKIRALKRFEGDTLIESRFGSSVRFGAYDDNKKNYDGLNDYSDGGGNPMILIRNRQPTVTTMEGNPGKFNKGYTLEEINKDGTSIQITSGKTETKFVTTTEKIMFQSGKEEEQSNFTPPKKTDFKIPKLDGDQVVINSDRLILSSKAGETFHYSKKRYSVVTDEEFCLDAIKQIMLTTQDDFRTDSKGRAVVTTNVSATINAPKIYLGEYEQTAEPVLLGQTSVDWLDALCNLLIKNITTQIGLAKCMAGHNHPKTKPTAPGWVAQIKRHIGTLRKQRSQLVNLRNSLPRLKSKRVFTVGGGGAPGHDGK